MAEVQGECDPKFESVRKVFEEHIKHGNELGASLYVDVGGKCMLDLYGGFTDVGRTKPWEKDTVVIMFSTTKVVITLAALILADMHELDLDAKVSRYWPEFAANGKQDITVSQVLTHATGLSGWEPGIVGDEIYDTKLCTERLAAQAPWWTPGTATGYHLVTYGHLIGEIIRRITGKSLTQFVAEHVAGACDADFQIGLAQKDWHRAAQIVPPETVPDMVSFDKTGYLIKSVMSCSLPAEATETAAFRASEIGASGGFGNARSLAQIGRMASLGGEIDGQRYIFPETLDRMFRENIKGTDLVMNMPLRWGLGAVLPDPAVFPYVPDTECCFWFGWGGSMVLMDRKHKMTIAYAMNKMGSGLTGNEHTEAYVRAIYAAVQGMSA